MHFKLFCLHFAGGSKYSFNDYCKLAPSFIKLVPLELPGRGSRIKEPLLTNIHAMVDDILNQLKSQLDKPYAFFGHSMGSLLTYLVTRKIIALGWPCPVHLFVGGRGGPSVIRDEPPLSELKGDEFIKSLKDMGGFQEELLQDAMVMEFFEPILKSDFRAIETYIYTEAPAFPIPITAMIGADEEVTYEEACAWKKESTGTVEIRLLPGRHFFIFDQAPAIMELIKSTLQTIFEPSK